MLLSHYCVVVAITDDGDAGLFGSLSLTKSLDGPPLSSPLSSLQNHRVGEGANLPVNPPGGGAAVSNQAAAFVPPPPILEGEDGEEGGEEEEEVDP